jgi:hypothetical protein
MALDNIMECSPDSVIAVDGFMVGPKEAGTLSNATAPLVAPVAAAGPLSAPDNNTC